MKILFYSPVQLVSGGGCERWHCDITNSLHDQFGYDIRIATANLGAANWTPDYLSRQLKSTPYTKINFLTLAGALIPTPGSLVQLYKLFRWADVIHVIHGFIGQDVTVLLLKWLTGKKVILGWHSPMFHQVLIHNWYMTYFSRYLLNCFDGHMTLNAKDKDFLEKKWHIKNVNFIPSGVRTEQFLSLKHRLHPKLNFLTVGHYRPQKGIDLALAAIGKFNQTNPNNKAVFRFVGSGYYEPLLSSYCLKYNNIINLGYVTYEHMPDMYQKSDVYFLPSREEPFGLVLIEAWSSGIPVLASKTEGPQDMVRPDDNGWFIAKLSPESIAMSLSKIYTTWITNPGQILSMEQQCRATGRLYSIDLTAQKMAHAFFKSHI